MVSDEQLLFLPSLLPWEKSFDDFIHVWAINQPLTVPSSVKEYSLANKIFRTPEVGNEPVGRCRLYLLSQGYG